MKKITFAAGCFWGVQQKFDKINGVISTKVGYCGGHKEDPTYEEVCSDTTGHAECLEIEFDETLISFEELLEKFWSIHNPTTLNRQGFDTGSQYRSAIFYYDEAQKEIALKAKDEVNNSKKYKNPVVTEIMPITKFWEAEKYHQHYYDKTGRSGC